MTRVERILATIRGEPADKIPKGEFHLEEGFITKLFQLIRPEGTPPIGFRAQVEACEILGLDAVVFVPKREQGENPWQELRHWREETDFFLLALLDGPFQGVAHRYPDFTSFLMDTVRDKENLKRHAEEIAKQSAELGRRALEAGAHGILIADDIAYHQGLYISPQMMRELFFPSLKELLVMISDQMTQSLRKIPVFFHSDGNILPILRDIKDLGFDGIHSLEPVMDIGKVREIVGDDFCLMGGFDLGWFSPEGTIRAEELLKKAGSRYIFGSSAGILDANLSVLDVLKVYRYVDQYNVLPSAEGNLLTDRA